MGTHDKSQILDEIEGIYSAAIKANKAKLAILDRNPKTAYIEGGSEGHYDSSGGRVKASVESARERIGYKISELEGSIGEVDKFRGNPKAMWLMTESLLKYALLGRAAEILMGVDPRSGMSLDLGKSLDNANLQYELAKMELFSYAEGVPENLEVELV